MARLKKTDIQEYRFKIDAYTPESIPMRHLAAYLSDLSILFGEESSVHFHRLEKGSTIPVIRVQREATPKVRERIHLVNLHEGPADAIDAAKRIDERLRKDNSDGFILAPDMSKVLIFPGASRPDPIEYGPLWQPGSIEGVPIKIGGEREWVPIHLETREGLILICHAKRSIAKQIAVYLFTSEIRVEGKGKWIRHGDGNWEMLHFSAIDFGIVGEATLQEDILKLQQLPARWKELDDPIGALELIRHDEVQ